MLTNKQKNGFFDAIREAKFNPADFTLTEDKEVLLTYTTTNYRFRVVPTLSGGRAVLSTYSTPDDRSLITVVDKFRPRGSFPTWPETYASFLDWLKFIKEEADTPDLWAEAAKTAQLFATASEQSDEKFTRTELAEVQGQLRLLQLSFTQAALPEAAKQKLIELTQTAAVKAEGLTKKDWQNWIIGGFISAIASLALNPTQAGEVLKLVKAAFGGLFLH